MLFLSIFDFWDNAVSGVGGAIFDGLRSLCYWLDTTIYNLIIYVYNWFLMLCNGRLLNSNIDGENIIKTVTDRFSFILGIFMFFVVATSFIRMILEPDKVTDKEMGMGAVVKKVILVVVMLGLSNTAFDLLYDFQSILLGNNKSGTNVIQNLLSTRIVKSQDFGAVLSANMLTSFYHVNEDLPGFNTGDADFVDCNNYSIILQNQILNNYSFEFGYNCLNMRTTSTLVNSGGMEQEVYVMKFMSIESVIVGCFILYMLFMYCIKVGIRMVQLAFLEILAPMAIISYLSPKKDTMFSKWGKIYVSTYIDVFIRVAIINLVVYLITIILDGLYSENSTFWTTVNASNDTTRVFMVVIMILALLTFAKRAPELLKEILPKGGPGSIGYGVSTKDMVGLGNLAGGITGAIGGFAGGLAAGSVGGAVFGLLRGGVGGLGNKDLKGVGKTLTTGFKGQRDASKKMADIRANGGSFWGAKSAQLATAFGQRTAYEDMELAYAKDQEFADTWKNIKSVADSEVDKHLSNYDVNYTDDDGRGQIMSLQQMSEIINGNVSGYSESDVAAFRNMYMRAHDAARDNIIAHGETIDDGIVTITYGDDIEVADEAARFKKHDQISALETALRTSGHVGNSGNVTADLKKAGEYHQKRVYDKVNDKSYQRAKANSGK